MALITSSRRSRWIVAAAVFFVFAGSLAAQAIPDLFGRFRGTGWYENRGANDKRDLSEISIDLKPSGSLFVSIRGKKVDVRMSGHATEWTRKHQFRVVIDNFDGQPSDIEGWIRVDDRGRFEHIALRGQKPGRIGVSFDVTGSNLDAGRPAPGVQAPVGNVIVTEEEGIIRRGLEYNQFRTGFARDCAAACRNDDRCQGFTWLANETSCHLLSTVSNGESNRNAVSGVKRTAGGGTQAGFDVREGMDQTGSDFSDLRTQDANACLASCNVNSRCEAFTYNTSSGICYLKSNVGAFRPLSGRISGARRR